MWSLWREQIESMMPIFDDLIPEHSLDGQDREELEQICQTLMPALVDKLPSDSSCKISFDRDESGQWSLDITCRFSGGPMTARAKGATPLEAFQLTRNLIEAQLDEWHTQRFSAEPEPLLPVGYDPILTLPRQKRVLIVDDDVDSALATQGAMELLGFATEIATRHEDLHRKIISSDLDLIVLDWKLNGDVTADAVVERAARLIGAFSDLRQKYHEKRPQVITYSALQEKQIDFPLLGAEYFDHRDHWQKPMPYSEVIKRASEYLPV
ncbi:MAG: hypothetical protein ACAH59_07950 [Pseudobdellovibrionaceae bacterium]